jgi:hypothetical protein
MTTPEGVVVCLAHPLRTPKPNPVGSQALALIGKLF